METREPERWVVVGAVAVMAVVVLASALLLRRRRPMPPQRPVAAPPAAVEPTHVAATEGDELGTAVPESRGLGRLVVYGTEGKATPLEVREVRVRVHIATPVALTEIEQTFFNPTDEQAEGTFYFPIPAGASLCRFAMYVGSRLMEGELVERTRARQVYESIVLRMRDPALMEWQEGNVFKTRVFPIPPRGPKRIFIGYTQLLPMEGGERRYVYPLISKAAQASRIGRFELEANVAGAAGGSSLRVPAFPDAELSGEGGELRARLVRRDFAPGQDFALRFTARRGGALHLITDRREGEDGFFLLSHLAEVTEPRRDEPEGRDLILLVDTSLSRRPDDYRVQLQVARALLDGLRPGDRFAVIGFDVEPCLLHNRFVSGRQAAGNAVKLLAQTPPLGGTNLEGAFEALEGFLQQAEPRERIDVVLMSDGVPTLGEADAGRLVALLPPAVASLGVRIHAVAVGARHDRLLLGELARRTGGLFRFIIPGDDVAKEAARLAQALRAPLVPEPEVRFGGVATHDIYVVGRGARAPGEELIVLGRYEDAGELQVHVTQGGAEAATAAFELPEADSRNVFIPRLWAREKLDHLLLQPQNEEVTEQVIALSQEFTLITPYTSFLVLETEEDYRTHGIDRRARRRYWEEMGKLRTAPPEPWEQPVEEPVEPQEPDFGGARFDQRWTGADLTSIPRVRPFSFADMDISLLRPRYLNRRVVTTALAAACLGLLDLDDGEIAIGEDFFGTEDDEEKLSGAAGPPTDLGRALAGLAASEAGAARFADQLDGSELPRHELVGDVFGDFDEAETQALSDLSASSGHRFTQALRADMGHALMTGERQWALASDGGYSRGWSGGGYGWSDSIGEDFFGEEDDGDDWHEDEEWDYAAPSGGGAQVSYENGRVVVTYRGSAGSRPSLWRATEWLGRRWCYDDWSEYGFEEAALGLMASVGCVESGDDMRDGSWDVAAWLIAQQDERGQIGRDAFEHALATCALCQAARLDPSASLRRAATRAVVRLVALGEGREQGWGDPFVSSWALLALAAAREARIELSPSLLDAARRYLDGITTETGAVGAEGRPKAGEVHLLHTAAAMAARVRLFGAEDARARAAARLLLSRVVGSPAMRDGELYLHYLGALALREMGGYAWQRWTEWSAEQLGRRQRAWGRDAGSWEPDGVWLRGRKPVPAIWLSPAELAPRLEAALARVEAEGQPRAAHDELAAALSLTCDHHVLKPTLARARNVSAAAQALVLLRMGMAAYDAGRFEEAARHFAAAYGAAGRPGNILLWQVDALRRGGQVRDALAVLLAEAGRPGGEWRGPLVAALLRDPAVGVSGPAAFVVERLRHAPLMQAQTLFALSEIAEAEGRHEEQVACLRQAFRASGRLAVLVEPYINALLEAERYADGATELERVIQSGYHTPWAFRSLARAYKEAGRGQRALLRALSSEVEVFPRDAEPRVAFAQQLEATGRLDDALDQYAAAIAIRPEDSGLYRQAIGRAAARGRYDLVLRFLDHGLEAGLWDDELGLDGESELLDLLKRRRRQPEGPDARELERRLRQAFARDLVVAIQWDTDGTDVDLHLVEPGGEECCHERMTTPRGGALDRDDTDGFGPETYSIRHAAGGRYRVDLVYYEGDRPTTVSVRIIRDWNTKDERAETHTVELTKAGQRVTVATVDVAARE